MITSSDLTAVHAPAGDVVDLIRGRTAVDPTATAIRTRHGLMPYEELWQRANAQAEVFRSAGVVDGSVVAVRLPGGPDAVVAMLGAWLAGAAFLPIDIATPDERRAFLLRDSGAAAIIDDAGVSRLTPDVGAVLGAAGAYVIYTSGSTGVPKGVVVGHRALRGHVAAAVDLFGLSSGDVVLQFASLGFDVAQEEIWPTLATGATLAFHGGGVPDAADLAAAVGDLGVTVLQLPTAYWRFLCADRGVASDAFASVRVVIIGGESATAADTRAHRASTLGHTTLVNGYGPTEAVVTATAFVLPPGGPLPATAGLPIGVAVGDRRLYILDEDRRPVIPGAVGELWIGGALLADGYLHDAARTAERFHRDPFDSSPGARMYRTGDIVRRHAGGSHEFVGRLDNQVKVRGHRIELDEVDRHLVDTPGVTAGITFTLDDGNGGYVLAAAVTVAEREYGADAIREHLGTRVPSYLIPSRIVVLDSLPTTTSGKIDRAAARRRCRQGPVMPADTTLSDRSAGLLDTVVGLLRERLRWPALGPDDDIVAHGGDSLLILWVCAELRSRGVVMRPADLIEGRTARSALARGDHRSVPPARRDEAARDDERPGPLDLLPAQHRWLRDGAFADPDHFCLNALFTTDANVDAARLADVADSLALRHPALRTALLPDGTVRLNDVDSRAMDAVRVVDVSGAAAAHRAGLIEAALQRSQTSLSLAHGRVFRLLYVVVGDGTARLLLTVHHFVLDGVSMGLLVDDLETLLGGGRPSGNPTGPRAIGAALRDWLNGPQARLDAAAWVAGVREFTSPTSTRSGPGLLPSLRVHRFRPAAATGRLVTHDLPAAGVAAHDFVLGCLAGGLAGWSGATVQGIDVYAHSRDVSVGDLDLSRTVAYVQSTFPMVLRWTGRGLPALRAALGPGAALPERRYGFDALRHCSPDPAERTSLLRCPRPVVRLNFRGHLLRMEQRAEGAVLRPAEENFSAQRSPRQAERYLLMIEGDIVDDALELSIKYSTDHWNEAEIAALATAIDTVMTDVLADVAGGAR
jgi:amino acid adenylation domain-containing protein